MVNILERTWHIYVNLAIRDAWFIASIWDLYLIFRYAFILCKIVSVLLNWFGFALSGTFRFISPGKLQTGCFVLILSSLLQKKNNQAEIQIWQKQFTQSLWAFKSISHPHQSLMKISWYMPWKTDRKCINHGILSRIISNIMLFPVF